MLPNRALRSASKSMVGIADAPASRAKRSIKDSMLMVKPGHRQAPCGLVTSVFGCTGFLGNYTVYNYGYFGSQVMCPYRGDAKKIRDLKVMGDLGQIVPIPFSFYDEDSIRRAVHTSHVVINCVNRNVETGQWNYHDSHVKTSYRLAKICKEAGVDKFIQMSALGASPTAESKWLRTKAEAEEAVKSEIDDAIIVRPGPMFGDEDQFINRIAHANNTGQLFPMLDDGQQKLQPVSVMDVASALLNIGTLSGTHGKTYHLGGPDTLTLRELQEMVREKIYLPPLTRLEELKDYDEMFISEDDLWMQLTDQVVPEGEDVLTFQDLLINEEDLFSVKQTSEMQLLHQRGTRGPPRFGHDESVLELEEWNSIWEDSELCVANPGIGVKSNESI